jgi:hypothetical protein
MGASIACNCGSEFELGVSTLVHLLQDIQKYEGICLVPFSHSNKALLLVSKKEREKVWRNLASCEEHVKEILRLSTFVTRYPKVCRNLASYEENVADGSLYMIKGKN